MGESVESTLSAVAAIFLALSAYFNNFRQKIPYFDVSRQKRVLFSLALTGSLCGSLWLLLALSLSLSVTPTLAPFGSLALNGSLRLSLALSGSYWISPCLSLALYGSLWLPLWLPLTLTATVWLTLALSGSLLLISALKVVKQFYFCMYHHASFTFFVLCVPSV